jgi:hypothetical protein
LSTAASPLLQPAARFAHSAGVGVSSDRAWIAPPIASPSARIDELVPGDRAQALELRRDHERAEMDAVVRCHADRRSGERSLDSLADLRRRHGGILKAAGTAVYDAGIL